ncbi:MAG: CbiX/SirB N-terminal domain-containing protein [Betaproteobacteria bacterium]
MTQTVHRQALLLFAHGSADPKWAEPFVKLQSVIRARDPAQVVELAFLERMAPSFDEAVAALHARGIRQITVAPLFLALGGHMRKDLPTLVDAAQQRTGIGFRVLPALGEVDTLIESIAAWVISASG